MARILFAWELGANLGHLARDLPVAKRLRAMGHQVAFVVRDTAIAAKLLLPEQFVFIQAPLAIDAPRGQRAPASFAELLLAEDFGRLAGLLGRVRAWCSLFDLAQPEVVVADHAPTALFAAHLRAVPRLAFGSGFEIPPQDSPLPSIRPWEKVSTERLIRAEHAVLGMFAQVTQLLGGKPLERFGDLFADAVLTTHPELDHYEHRNSGVYVGTMPTLETARKVTWPKGAGPRIFAYLRPSQSDFVETLGALSQFDGVVITVAPGISRTQLAQFATPRHLIIPEQIQLKEVLKEADVVLSYGGAGLVVQSLQAGVPMLLMPQHVEQWLGAQRVKALGAGYVMEKNSNRGDIRTALVELTNDSVAKAAATRFALQHSADDSDHNITLACTAILAKIESKPNAAI